MKEAQELLNGLSWLGLPLLATDRHGIILAVNGSLTTLFGHRDDAPVDGFLSDHVASPGLEEWLVQAAARGPASPPLLTETRPVDGRPRKIALRVLPSAAPEIRLFAACETSTGQTLAEDDERNQRQILLELDAIFTHASLGIIYSRQRIIQRCNPRAAEILGYSPGELPGQPGISIYPSREAYEALGRTAGPLLAAGNSFSTEVQFRRKDGSLVWCRIFAKAYDPEDTQRGTIWILEDIEESRRAQAALAATLRELEAIMNNASVGILFTRDGTMLRYNPKFAEMFLAGESGMAGLPARMLFASDAAYEALGREAFPLLSVGKPFHSEMLAVRRDGSAFPAEVIGYLIDPTDPPHGTIWILNDISERRAAEEIQRQTLLELDAIFTNASVGIVYSRGLVLQRCNPRAAQMLGYSPGELVGQPASLLAPSEELSRAHGAAADPLLKAGRAYGGEAQFRRKDGSLIWCEFIAQALDPDHLDRGVIWIGTDIEGRRRAQEELNAALRELEAIMNNASVGILLTRDRKIQRHNRKFGEMFGFAGDAAIGQPGRCLYRSDDEYAELGRIAGPRLSVGQPFQSELYMRRQDGGDLWVNLIGYVSNPEQPTQGTIWILEDRTDFKRADEALHQSYAELERRVVERTAELSQQLHFLQQLIEAIPGPVFYKDAATRYLGCNSAFEDFIGMAAADLIGKRAHDIAPTELADVYLAADRELLDHPGSQIYESQARNSRGELRNVVFHKATFTRPDGEVGGLVGVILDITERKRTEALLRDSEEQLRAIADNATAVIFLKDTEGKYLRINRRYEEIFHLAGDDIIGRTDHDLFPPETAELFSRNDRRVIESGTSISVEEVVLQDGQLHTYLSVKFPLRRASGEIYAVGGIATDITERIVAEQNLRVAATTFESQEGMMITDAEEIILRVNQAFTEITGYAAEEVVGQTPRILRSGRHDAAFYAGMWANIRRTGSWQGELWNRRKNGELYPQTQTITAVRRDDGLITHYVGTFADITQRKMAEDEIRDLAFYDPLTRLPNRRLLLDRLRHTFAGIGRSQRSGALMFIDLDNFKTLNDTRGHDVGDRLLVEAALRLQGAVRQCDTVARLGGDEFVVMLDGLEPGGMAAAQAEAVAVKILGAISQPYQLRLSGEQNAERELDYRCTASIGITLYDGQRRSVDELLKQADLAMYQAKSAGRNALRFFDPEMQARVMARAALEVELRRAIHGEEFLLHYQAQVNEAGTLTGVEALVRWQHPQRGLVPPAEFIPLAEETGLILPLGHWVLETACAQIRAWEHRPERAHLAIAVNVSLRQIRHPDFVDQVLAILDHSGARPQKLKLELTETLLMDDSTAIITKMSALKARGVGFSLDDFGTGYSSLSYLKRLPLDQMKIDHSFVREVLADHNSVAICGTIIALGSSLGLEVIAEGVESEAQRDLLSHLGCRAYQGYFYSRPLPIGEFEQYAGGTAIAAHQTGRERQP